MSSEQIRTEITNIEEVPSILAQTHPNLYHENGCTEKEFDEAFKVALTVDLEFRAIAMQEAFALFRDAHTRVDNYRLDPLGVEFSVIQEKVYITSTLDKDIEFLGEEVTEINGYPIADVIEDLMKLSSRESGYDMKAVTDPHKQPLPSALELYEGEELARSLRSERVLRYYKYSNGDDVILSTPKGKLLVSKSTDPENTEMKILNPLNEAWDPEKYDSEIFGNDYYRYRLVGNTVVFQYNSCDIYPEESEEDLKRFQEELLLYAQRYGRIVIDLRQNGGGNSDLMQSFFDLLPSSPWKMLIEVAVSKKTFSSGVLHAFDLYSKRNITVLGEYAGQLSTQYGNIKEFKLPGNIQFSSSTQRYQHAGQYAQNLHGHPYIPVTIDNYKQGTDPLLPLIESWGPAETAQNC